MKLKQLSVFLENKKGRLYEICDILGSNNINIRALTIAESADFGVLRMFVDKADVAIKLLKDKGFVASFSDIVVLEVEDKPGGLASVLKILVANDINVEYMYAFVEKRLNKALLVFRFADIDRAISALKENNIGLLNQEIEGV